jgi:EAL domain-containing protein (putative c-di-GMP-specific phosphodiesterase class I)/GGDEF domain-containing protein
VRIVAQVGDDEFRRLIEQVAGTLDAELVLTLELPEENGAAPLKRPDVLLVQLRSDTDVQRLRAQARRAQAALLFVCNSEADCPNLALADADDWIMLPTSADELELRLAIARRRSVGMRSVRSSADAAELVRYEEMLYDRLTGFPTLAVMIERARELLERRGELTVLYIHFVWYEKIEEIYGWQKLDDVLETTAQAVRRFYAREHSPGENIMMVSHIADDDFILFTEVPAGREAAEHRLREISSRLESFLRANVEDAHGDDIAALCGIYVGAATVFRNPKIRTERLIYRGIREAAQAARGAEDWERSRKVNDLKSTIRDGAVFIEYHPIIVTATEEVYGFEALARGIRRELRSPEVLFEVAEEAKMVWELSRLLRQRAVSGIINELKDGQFLFLNIDPHDFDDPTFRNMQPEDLGIPDPSRVVLEITERTAIKDYPRFQEYLKAFRERGFRFAVDDAGSGYAGLGSIANLEPDYIKLDISLIANIDTNFLKQNLVETMMTFANNHGTLVIAEGVERREEFETVRQLGVHFTQGFLFHKPRYAGLPAAALKSHVSHAANRNERAAAAAAAVDAAAADAATADAATADAATRAPGAMATEAGAAADAPTDAAGAPSGAPGARTPRDTDEVR